LIQQDIDLIIGICQMFELIQNNIEEEVITDLFVLSCFTTTLSSFIYLRIDHKVD